MGEEAQQLAVSNRLQSIYVTAAFILFVLALIFGMFSGVKSGKDQATYRNVETINNALHYYFTDQDSYPTAEQFNNQEILVPLYMPAIPVPDNVSGVCKDYQKFDYSQQNNQSFNLKFCLTKGLAGLSAGVHTLTEKELQ